MPLYDYKCRSCGNTFDKLLSVSRKDEPKSQPCPTCGEMEIEEHIVTANFLLNDGKPSGEFKELLQKIQAGAKPKIPTR